MKFINHVNPVNPVKKDLWRGFTIVELLVAMSLLVILLGLSGMVFNTTVQAHRAAGASIDVTRNLRAITEQLSADFRGLRKDVPLMIAFNRIGIDEDNDTVVDYYSHFDTIHFFADGDFQTTRPYTYWRDSNNDGVLDINDREKTIHANIARIYYGHSNTPGNVDYIKNSILVRKPHLLTVDNSIMLEFGQIPEVSNWPNTPLTIDYTQFPSSFGSSSYSTNYPDENELEFNTITLTNWINALNYIDLLPVPAPNNANHFIANCMTDPSRPMVDLADINTLHLLLSQGVIQMQIQWAYTNEDLVDPGTGLIPVPPLFTGIRWWPDVDPLGDGNDPGNDGDSDFLTINRNQLGVYFTLPAGANVDLDVDGFSDWLAVQNCGTLATPFKNTFYPKALKFTFVLTDSNGVFTEGKTFTHIVYLDN